MNTVKNIVTLSRQDTRHVNLLLTLHNSGTESVQVQSKEVECEFQTVR